MPNQDYFYRSFRQLSDEELADKFANQHLADEARTAVARLLTERGIAVQETLHAMDKEFAVINPPPPASSRVEHPVPTEVVGSYSTAIEAEMICGLLAQAGIDAWMTDAQTVAANHLWSNAIGGVRVKVAFTDLQAAQAVVASWQDGGFTLHDVEEAEEAQPPASQTGVGDWVPGYLREKSRSLWFRRLMAFSTDYACFLLASLVFGMSGLGWLASWLPPMSYQLDVLEWSMLISLPYFWLLEGLTGGTIGKYLWSIRVVDRYGRRPGLLRALPRTLLRLIELNPYLFGVIIGGGVAVMSKTGQRLGDMAGGTYVVDAEVLQTVRG